MLYGIINNGFANTFLFITINMKQRQLVTLHFIRIRHDNTILGAASASPYSSYVTPLYYIAK